MLPSIRRHVVHWLQITGFVNDMPFEQVSHRGRSSAVAGLGTPTPHSISVVRFHSLLPGFFEGTDHHVTIGAVSRNIVSNSYIA